MLHNNKLYDSEFAGRILALGTHPEELLRIAPGSRFWLTRRMIECWVRTCSGRKRMSSSMYSHWLSSQASQPRLSNTRYSRTPHMVQTWLTCCSRFIQSRREVHGEKSDRIQSAGVNVLRQSEGVSFTKGNSIR